MAREWRNKIEYILGRNLNAKLLGKGP